MTSYDVWVKNVVVGTVIAATWSRALDMATKQYGNCWVTESK